MLAGASPHSEALSIISAQQALLLWPPLPGNDPPGLQAGEGRACCSPVQSQEQSLGVQILSQVGAELQHKAAEGCLHGSPCISVHR